MDQSRGSLVRLSDDVFLLILDRLDTTALSRLSSTCHSLRTLLLPHLVNLVDLSYHSDGIEDANQEKRILMDYAPIKGITSRQRAFERFMLDRPDMALHVKTLFWTLIWEKRDETPCRPFASLLEPDSDGDSEETGNSSTSASSGTGQARSAVDTVPGSGDYIERESDLAIGGHLVNRSEAMENRTEANLDPVLKRHKGRKPNLRKLVHRTWDVFILLKNVRRLDLASMRDRAGRDHEPDHPYVFFPRVTDLRLGGWMARWLVKAIITSIDSEKLCSLQLDCLREEGRGRDGSPLSYDASEDNSLRDAARDEFYADSVPPIIDDELFERQESGSTSIFLGPMWLPLRLLNARPLPSQTTVDLRLPVLNELDDRRNYNTFFRESAEMLIKAGSTLTSLRVIFPVDNRFFDDCEQSLTRYATACVVVAATFLHHLLTAITS